ncbi:D-alanine--D-alanine ligase [Aerococcus suis]|uniref:D-alanine--D-alanine ligase n=1 Tax=Aerococcus suis TaxID=371602 RepID=A0A1W1YRG8_9LACT|nr:D-alanine--D-alanine ligase [Aerococcus suis]MCI7239783.1 D-alanine--D-alanine ligase [Aerococcus suis]MDD7758219.1 D-alanine--D-alanine ligase [Aerococcus suis]MDY4646696.1 D-alanine--D-alanine ligase [Aerococcus suis]SMC38805.1 D-alanine-D-alanine ligase [Aerococcus suis]
MEIVLLYGGKSAEHDISILTAQSIIQTIDYHRYAVQPVYIKQDGIWVAGEKLTQAPDKEWSLTLEIADDAKYGADQSTGREVVPTDVLSENTLAFPALHGPNGEDGTIQGLFETLNIPYVGAGVLASAAGMDKLVSKYLFEKAGIPQLPYIGLTQYEWQTEQETLLNAIQNQLGYPVFVKPANLGSSVGISQANTPDEVVDSINLALQFDRRVVVEESLANAREVELAVMGNDYPKVSVPGELVKEQGFYDYEEKYINNTVQMAIPAHVSDDLMAQLQTYAKQAYVVIDGSGLTRCDFFVTQDEKIYINEVNTLPGFTQFSMYPSLWEATGKPYAQLIQELLDLAMQRYEQKQQKQNQLEH